MNSFQRNIQVLAPPLVGLQETIECNPIIGA